MYHPWLASKITLFLFVLFWYSKRIQAINAPRRYHPFTGKKKEPAWKNNFGSRKRVMIATVITNTKKIHMSLTSNITVFLFLTQILGSLSFRNSAYSIPKNNADNIYERVGWKYVLARMKGDTSDKRKNVGLVMTRDV